MAHFRWLTAGESHGPGLIAIIDGVPAGLALRASDIDEGLARRQRGYGRGGRMKIGRHLSQQPEATPDTPATTARPELRAGYPVAGITGERTELPRERANPLDWVASGDADFAVIDENDFQFARHLNPEVVVAFRLPDPRPLQWLIRRDGLDLRDAVNAFFGDATRSGLLARLEREAKAEAHDFEYLQAQRYQEDIANRLPQLRGWFEDAGNANDIDWRLLAAISYQESKWQAEAASVCFVLGGVTMPLVCFLSAWRSPCRHLFFIPVTALVLAVALTLTGLPAAAVNRSPLSN